MPENAIKEPGALEGRGLALLGLGLAGGLGGILYDRFIRGKRKLSSNLLAGVIGGGVTTLASAAAFVGLDKIRRNANQKHLEEAAAGGAKGTWVETPTGESVYVDPQGNKIPPPEVHPITAKVLKWTGYGGAQALGGGASGLAGGIAGVKSAINARAAANEALKKYFEGTGKYRLPAGPLDEQTAREIAISIFKDRKLSEIKFNDQYQELLRRAYAEEAVRRFVDLGATEKLPLNVRGATEKLPLNVRGGETTIQIEVPKHTSVSEKPAGQYRVDFRSGKKGLETIKVPTKVVAPSSGVTKTLRKPAVRGFIYGLGSAAAGVTLSHLATTALRNPEFIEAIKYGKPVSDVLTAALP